MKLLIVFSKTMRELSRDWLVLILTIVTASAFVLLYKLMFIGGSTTYRILIVNEDQSRMEQLIGLDTYDHLLTGFDEMQYDSGAPMLSIETVDSYDTGKTKLQNKQAEAMLILEAGFSQAMVNTQKEGISHGVPIKMVGDLSNSLYLIAAILATTAVEGFVQAYTGTKPLLSFSEKPLGSSGKKTEFDLYIPGLLIFSIIMLVFISSMTVTREVESGAMKRLKLSHVRSFDLLGGISLAFLIVGMVALGFTFGVALLLGFNSYGNIFLVLLIAGLSIFSVVGVGLLVACFAKTVTQAFLIANFPLILMMFFSGSIYPIPPIPLFMMLGQPIHMMDFLPVTHAVSALNKVLTYGVGIDQLVYEMCALGCLSVLYFALGVILFNRLRFGSR
jgi:ABC-2 type transport system permease protein